MMFVSHVSKTLAVSLLVAGFMTAPAMADPVKERKAAMKSVGGAMKASAAMLKGELDYDAAKAAAAMQTMNDVAKKFGALFPEDSDMDPDTTAAPEIWSDRAGFTARLAQFEKDTAAAVQAAAGGKGAFAAALGAVGKNCKACHETYRIKKE